MTKVVKKNNPNTIPYQSIADTNVRRSVMQIVENLKSLSDRVNSIATAVQEIQTNGRR